MSEILVGSGIGGVITSDHNLKLIIKQPLVLTETLSNIDGKFVAVNGALAGKVDAVEGSRLITNDEAKKLGALVLEGDNVAISGTVGAAKVQELYDNVLRIVTGSGFAEYDGQQRALLGIAPGAEVNVI